MTILLKSPKYDIVSKKKAFSFLKKTKVMVILLKSPKYDVVTKKKGFSPLKLQKVITSKNRHHSALEALNQKL